MNKTDENEIRKTFAIINPELTEVRIIGAGFTASGYFKDADALIYSLKMYASKENVNFYMVMNKINQACYSRAQMSKFVERPKETTSDRDITGREWIMLDFDCDRPAGVSSTAEELKLAKTKAGEVYKYLNGMGFSKPVVALSGNGVHLLYKIRLANDEKSTKLVKDCLSALDMMFSDENVKVDTSVYNASRITKLYGTMASKGQHTEERPHRMSRITDIPKEIKATPADILLTLANKIPEPPARPAYQGQFTEFDLDQWLREQCIGISKTVPYQSGVKHILRECPFNSDHKDAAVFKLANGAIGFSCFHNSCQQYNWQDFRRHYEPDAYTQRTTPRVNSQQPVQTETKTEEKDPYADEPDFWTAETIKQVDRSQIVSIKTGIHEIDRRMAGLNKGEVTCVSGVNSSGKSSVLSQFALEATNQGYKTALFSGEMNASRVLGWLQLQAAGRLYTTPTDIPDYYKVPEETKKMINTWLNGSLFLYNNNKGNYIDKILDRVQECIQKQKVDLVILDNLMAMNLSAIPGDKYEKQSAFIKTIKTFATQNDVHIILVAHPRKSMGFLRKEDISGTADLTNIVDNVIIAHRVNADFKRKGAETFGWHEGHELFAFSNVIEVCKNRDLGIQDLFVGLHYEVESKRYLNEMHEVKHYKWVDAADAGRRYDWSQETAQLPFDV